MVNVLDTHHQDNSDDDQLKLYLRKFALGRLNFPLAWLVGGRIKQLSIYRYDINCICICMVVLNMKIRGLKIMKII